MSPICRIPFFHRYKLAKLPIFELLLKQNKNNTQASTESDMADIPFVTKKKIRDSQVKMKEHLEAIKTYLDGRQVEFVLGQDQAAIHALANSMGFPSDWPDMIFDESLSEIAKAIRTLSNHQNPRIKSSFFATFTGNKIIFRIPSLNNPDGRISVDYSFEDGNLVCSRGSEFNCNLHELGLHSKIESALNPNFDVSGAKSAADVESLWIEAINDIAKREDCNKALQETLEQLLKKGAKVDLPKFGERGTLTPAAFLLNKWKGESNLQCVEFFVNNGADVYALIETAVYRSRALLFRLLKRPGVDVNHQDVNGKTFLHYAAEEYNDPKLITRVKNRARRLSTEEIWVNPAGEFLAWKTDPMYAYYDPFFAGLKNVTGIDVTLEDKNGRTALDLARRVNNIWILPGLETFHNSRLTQSPKSTASTPQLLAGAVKKMPVGKPQSPAAPKFNGGSGNAKLPKELISLLEVMYSTIKQSATDTTALEQEYKQFMNIFSDK